MKMHHKRRSHKKHSAKRHHKKRGGMLALSPAELSAVAAPGPQLEDVMLGMDDQMSVDWKKAEVAQGGFAEGDMMKMSGGKKHHKRRSHKKHHKKGGSSCMKHRGGKKRSAKKPHKKGGDMSKYRW